MPARTFDWRDDPMGTIIAVPEVRARFMVFEPNVPYNAPHTHEESGAFETFCVIEGALTFEIDGVETVVNAGQAIVTNPREVHRVRCASAEPAILFLTVSPHREPTHTFYDAAGQRLPTRTGAVTPTWQGKPALGS